MTGHAVAWLVVALAGLGAAGLAWAATRRALVATLVLVWAVAPYRFDAGDWAPAVVVAGFRLFLEEGLDPLPPLGVLAGTTAATLAAFLAGWGAGVLAARLRRGRAAPSGPGETGPGQTG